ncbi:MAG: hypothetical protein RIS47_1328 [Bacteroidota bacterium]|jgi:RimJ/RimL family protein N-acetyltransferase
MQTDKNIFLRRFMDQDAPRLAELANNKHIWNFLRDRMPHPYTLAHAEHFIAQCNTEGPQLTFAIDYMGELAGVIGLVPKKDIHRFTCELGFWVGEPYWGKGIISEAVPRVLVHAFGLMNCLRVETHVFATNVVSQHVMDKCGFNLEAHCKSAAVKNGEILDEFRYSVVNPNFNAAIAGL